MLKSYSKKAMENVRQYILEHFDATGYDFKGNAEDFKDVAEFIKETFYVEMVRYDKRNLSQYAYFEEWCSGLPSVLDTCYYYNRSAIEDVGNILEETEEERNLYTERQAERFLTSLIYREIFR